jgi:hypothetical protein
MEEIFNIIVQDKKFLENVKSSVNNIMIDGKIDMSDIPEIILLITTTINTFNNLNINESMLPELIKKIFDFVIPNKNPEFDKIINSTIKLVMFQPIVQKEVKKCCNFFSCFKKKENNKEVYVELKVDEVKVDEKVNEVKVDEKVNDEKVNEIKVDEKVNKVKVEEVKVDEVKVDESVKKNKVKLDNLEITSDDELVNINVLNDGDNK